MSDATTTLLTSWEEKTEVLDGGAIVTSFGSGQPHVKAIYSAVLDRYTALSGRPVPTDEDLQAFVGEKVTIVKHGSNMIGGEMIVAQEGTVFAVNGGFALLPKRARTKGYRIGSLLDMFPGYSAAEAQAVVDKVRSHFPQLKPLTQERLNELPSNSETLTLCAFGSYRMPDSTQADAIVLVGEYLREDDILDGGVVLMRPEYGVSEHGSFYGQQLLGGRFGEVVGYQPISFAEGLHLCNLDFDEAYAQVVPL